MTDGTDRVGEAGGARWSRQDGGLRLLVVSHPAVIAENQAVYVSLLEQGVDVHLVVPDRWQHDYTDQPLPAQVDPRMGDRVHTARVWPPSSIQRHVHVRPRPSAWLDRLRPDVVFVEEEHYSMAARQWGWACARAGIPFGVQADENLDRPLPAVARVNRRVVLATADFVAARSPEAARLVRRFTPPRARPLRSAIVPHPLPLWDDTPDRRDAHTAGPAGTADDRPFVVGFAGRLVEAKGVLDLFAAVELLARARESGPRASGPRASGSCASGSCELVIAGSGEQHPTLVEQARRMSVPVRFDGPVAHAAMPAWFAAIDVLVLPSRTTPTWAEQFGRVLVEAAWCGVPVVGSSSGAIPWVVESLGGQDFREGDAADLARALRATHEHPTVAPRSTIADRFGAPATALRLAALARTPGAATGSPDDR